ncbi:MAG TPA: glycoside hydrolase family 3 protein, partial [Streptomyces sp.]|nr:glycoside hydrolase family 3 protein [Streptomyces sp.]
SWANGPAGGADAGKSRERSPLGTAVSGGGARTDGRAGDRDVGLEAARRALRVTGMETHEPLTRPPFVAAFTPTANIAVGGETPWGVAAELALLLPGTETVTYGAPETPEPGEEGPSGLVGRVLGAAAGRRIVAVVRDVHRHPWMADALGALLAARPETVVVEMGVPQAPPAGSLHIATHGAARVCGRAAAEVIAGKGADG